MSEAKHSRSERTVDLNADLGESFGVYKLGADHELLSVVTSANIACGFHAGDPTTVRTAVEAALAAGVAVGAHPGLPDRLGFGRRMMELTEDEAYDLVLYQVSVLYAVTRAYGGELRHVKPHGALYNMAAKQASLAAAIARAVAKVDTALVLVGLAGSEILAAAERHGLASRSEVFADRRYHCDGSLVSRNDPRALIEDAEECVAQAIRMTQGSLVRALDGIDVPVRAETICIHGDGQQAVNFAHRVRTALTAAGIVVTA
ncbi:LamB/YcsF family protein [Alicyclobacillus sp. ALC3]|uniref:LamB/YcsF family protein n=1 Tax=Alicyclobacillus sp. ALC3 TaxID=2796143 RepID=UPI002379E465|nr:5-oxoprolinase subunit PxpA [Alicyclobacillus sp. ALC3]WDL96890.1 LamB/YcsF family protein [Alicyclobacillus sp. ALC3]